MRKIGRRAAWILVSGPLCLILLGVESHAKQSAEVLFPVGGVNEVAVSPAGDWVIAHAIYGNANGLLVQSTTTGEIANVFATRMWLRRLAWVDRNSILAEYISLGRRRTMVVRFRLSEDRVEFDQEWIGVAGHLVDALPLIDGELIWHTPERAGASLRRVTIDRLLEYGKRGARRGRLGSRLALLDLSIGLWITDGDGEPRAARRDGAGSSTVLFRGKDDSEFRDVYTYSAGDEAGRIELVGLAPGNGNLIVIAYNGHDTKGLFELDPATGEIGKELFRNDDGDVSDVLVDPITRELIAAEYVDRGDAHYAYFSGYQQNILAKLGQDFPAESVAVLSSTADRRSSVFYVSGPKNPGTHYFYDARLRKTTLIAERGSGIDRDSLRDVESVLVRSKDGTEIEAYLTLPNLEEGEKAPLVVMPHGGPFGVRDNREYNPRVQYLASWGFAVLQPNFRGSEGYGRVFSEAGKKSWATGIEDDIDAAVGFAMSLPAIDADRICIVGGSYGGFSALASVVRHESRYRCAISVNGVSDIPLLFDTSDWSDSIRSRARMKELVGDFETERDDLIAVSPAYSVKGIETPILLIYGTEDRRVDPDHSHRMLLMLETYGKEHESMEIEGMGHGLTRDQWVEVVRRMRRFLTSYLLPGETFREDPMRTRDELLPASEAPSGAGREVPGGDATSEPDANDA